MTCYSVIVCAGDITERQYSSLLVMVELYAAALTLLKCHLSLLLISSRTFLSMLLNMLYAWCLIRPLQHCSFLLVGCYPHGLLFNNCHELLVFIASNFRIDF